jgi:WD40 repeat protein
LNTSQPVTPPEGESLVGVAEDGVTVLTQLRNQTFQVRNLRTGTAGKPFGIPGGLGPDPDSDNDDEYLLRVIRVAFSPDRKLVAVITFKGTTQLHRADTGELVGLPIVHLVRGKPEGIRAVQFSPDGARLLTQGDHVRGLWLTTSAEEEHVLYNPVGIQMSRFSQNGRFVLSATNYELAQLWDVEKKELKPYALVHASQVWGMDTNRALDRVATASYDHTARTWDLATGLPASPPLFHREGVSDVKFAPDQKHFLTGSWDRRARLWNVIEPVPDEIDRITAWVETMTGMRIGATGTPELLTAEEWTTRKKLLDGLGGPPWTHVRPTEVNR